MTGSNRGADDRGMMERMGRGVGGAAGRAADMAAGFTVPLLRTTADILGGWWSGASARQAAGRWGPEQDQRCRQHFESRAGRSGAGGAAASGTRGYEDARPYYQLGHTAAQNPEYRAGTFDDVEPDLRRVWAEGKLGGENDWPEARGFIEFGYGGLEEGESESPGSTGGGSAGSGGASGAPGGDRMP